MSGVGALVNGSVKTLRKIQTNQIDDSREVLLFREGSCNNVLKLSPRSEFAR